MTISILTLFPTAIQPYVSSSILGRAQKKHKVKIRLIDIRTFATGRHKSVDDKPYGGGAGMVMRVDVLERAIKKSKINPSAGEKNAHSREKIILLDPKGTQFTQSIARRFSKLDHIILLCGHYEGVDERISHFIDERISIGNFILTGGEIPALTITDAVVRLIPGVLSKNEATRDESFTTPGLLEAPHYTRPSIHKGYTVPKILLSGDHHKIEQWRTQHAKLLK